MLKRQIVVILLSVLSINTCPIWSNQLEKHTLLENGTDNKIMRLSDLHAVASKITCIVITVKQVWQTTRHDCTLSLFTTIDLCLYNFTVTVFAKNSNHGNSLCYSVCSLSYSATCRCACC